MYIRFNSNSCKTLLIYLISFFLIYTPTLVFAGAAEKWQYEPVQKDMNIKVSAHKVDQYGSAVNDLKYETTIDPKTQTNRTKAGGVAINKLLKRANWALVGVAALQTLLEAVDWVIDPETQSIWRNKKPKTDSSGVSEALCKGGTLKNYSGQYVKILLWTSTHTVGDCPLQAAESLLKYYSNNNGRNYQFIRWLPEKDVDVGYLYYTKTFIYNDPQYGNREAVVKVKTGEVVQPNPEKEYLTPEDLADYANHTHPDYSNPELAPKLEPKYKPEIQTDLWKPHNKWEEDNSDTVKEVKRQLDKESPKSKDSEIKNPETKPDGTPGNFALPEFCSWATSVCDFFKWIKDNPENENEEPEKPEIKDHDLSIAVTNYIQFGSQCPQDRQIPLSMGGQTLNLIISYQPLCTVAQQFRPAVILMAFLAGAFIITNTGRRAETGD